MHAWLQRVVFARAWLTFTAALSMAAYVLFKACEHRLVHGLCDPKKVE
jgi:hypothetical protein